MTRQFLLLSGLRFVKLGIGLASLIAYGRLFGVGRAMDTWIFGSGLVAALGMMAWGPVNEVCRSRYLHHIAQSGEINAIDGLNQLIRFSLLISAVLGLSIIFSKSILTALLYPGQDQLAKLEVEHLLVWLAPTLLLGQFLNLGSACLNCRGFIYSPELVGIAGGLLNLACVIIYADQYGVFALVFGFNAWLVLASFAITILLIRAGVLHFRALPLWGPLLRDYFRFSSPLLGAYGAGQVNGVLEKSLATSLGEGVLSSVNYAAQIKATLQAVVASVLLSLAVNRLTRVAELSDQKKFELIWRQVQRLAFLFLLIFMPPIFGAAEQIPELLFKSVRDKPEEFEIVALLICAYMVALLPSALYIVHGAALLAHQRARAYAGWGLMSQIMSSILLIVLIKPLNYMAFPLAIILSSGTAAVFMARAVGPSLTLWCEAGITLLALAIICLSWMLLATYTKSVTGSALISLTVVCFSHLLLIIFLFSWYKRSGANFVVV